MKFKAPLERTIKGSAEIDFKITDVLIHNKSEEATLDKMTIVYDYNGEKRVIDPAQVELAEVIGKEFPMHPALKDYAIQLIKDDLDGLRSRVKED